MSQLILKPVGLCFFWLCLQNCFSRIVVIQNNNRITKLERKLYLPLLIDFQNSGLSAACFAPLLDPTKINVKKPISLTMGCKNSRYVATVWSLLNLRTVNKIPVRSLHLTICSQKRAKSFSLSLNHQCPVNSMSTGQIYCRVGNQTKVIDALYKSIEKSLASRSRNITCNFDVIKPSNKTVTIAQNVQQTTNSTSTCCPTYHNGHKYFIPDVLLLAIIILSGSILFVMVIMMNREIINNCGKYRALSTSSGSSNPSRSNFTEESMSPLSFEGNFLMLLDCDETSI